MKIASARPTTLTVDAAAERTARLAHGVSWSIRWTGNELAATNSSALVDHGHLGRIQPTFNEKKVEAHGV